MLPPFYLSSFNNREVYDIVLRLTCFGIFPGHLSLGEDDPREGLKALVEKQNVCGRHLAFGKDDDAIDSRLQNVVSGIRPW